jgi:hypothetical protein
MYNPLIQQSDSRCWNKVRVLTQVSTFYTAQEVTYNKENELQFVKSELNHPKNEGACFFKSLRCKNLTSRFLISTLGGILTPRCKVVTYVGVKNLCLPLHYPLVEGVHPKGWTKVWTFHLGVNKGVNVPPMGEQRCEYFPKGTKLTPRGQIQP